MYFWASDGRDFCPGEIGEIGEIGHGYLAFWDYVNTRVMVNFVDDYHEVNREIGG